MKVWIKAIFALLVIAALVWMIVKIGGFGLNILAANGGKTDGRDPQFAEEAERITQPPELWEEDAQKEFKDNSANWDTSVQTPVDQTADELGDEARGVGN